MAKMPALFVGHGSPMNVVLDNPFTRSLREWGRRLPRPRAVLVVSAHWLTDGTFVSCTPRPRTIHDFYGFPEELYAVAYPSPGAPEEAEHLTRAVGRAPVACDDEWGLDHGAWSVLRHLFPGADVPVFQLSIDYSFNDRHPKPVRYHYDLAKDLRPLRDRGVLVVGSGNIVHNLSAIDFRDMDAPPYPWALEFDERAGECLVADDHESLIDFGTLGPSAPLAVPTLDHYLPMIYALALREEGEPLTFAHEGMQNASISMRCFQLG
ncbi:MAG: 4,5-DOPA dioxygenase extradiol [Deferrisomatales bacterium]|nr:4,5-DOPA dioxygenase extradiol [Deferrisomatales bacterium]